MKNALLFVMILVSPIVVFGQTTVPGGNVSGTWTSSGSPYNVMGSIMIPADSTLYIGPGVIVSFQGQYKFLVLGQLLAIGTFDEAITFKAADPTTGWRGVQFVDHPDTNDSSIFSYCTFLYGRATDPYNAGGAMIISQFSAVRIIHCIFKNNYADGWGGAMYINECNPVITDNTFDSNVADFQGAANCGGGAIYCSGSSPRISGNIFMNNSSNSQVAGGGAICFNDGTPLIDNNLIIHNKSLNNGLLFGQGGGGGIFASGAGTIINNTISNNYVSGLETGGGGVFNDWQDHSTVMNNLITNNSATSSTGYGGGVYFTTDCHPTYINNTIANNYANADGGGMCFNFTGQVTFKNCIIYGNTSGQDTNQVYLYDEGSDPDFTYCDIQRGRAGFSTNGNFYTGIYENNIDLNPGFMWPSGGSGSGNDGIQRDWTESPDSPCINAGDPSGTYPATDKAGFPRIVDGRIDIGPFEYQWPVGVQGCEHRIDPMVYPNPFSDFCIVYFKEIVSNATFRIYDPSGKLLRIIENISGTYIRIDRGYLPAGICFFELILGGKTVSTGKLIVNSR